MREHPLLMKGPLVRATLEGRKTQTRRPIKQEAQPDLGFEWSECLCREIDPNDTPCVTCSVRFPGIPEAGDRLWVRETLWRSECRQYVAYAADNESRADVFSKDRKWLASTVNLHGECAKTEFQVVSYSNDGPGGWTAGLARLDLTVPIKAFTGNAIVDSADAVFRRKIPGIHMPRWACRLVLPLVSVRVERVQDITEEDAKAEGVEPVLMRGIGSYPEWMRPTMREVGGHQKAFELLWKQIYGDALWDANPWVWVAEWEDIEVSR